MKILFSTDRFYPFTISRGAERYMYLLAKELLKKHEVHCIFPAETNKDYVSQKLNVHKRDASYFLESYLNKSVWLNTLLLNMKWKRILENFIKTNKPDIIITQPILSPATVEIAKKYKIKSTLFIHDLLHISPNGFFDQDPLSNGSIWKHMPGRSKLFYPLFNMVSNMNKNSLKNSDVVICNSESTRKINKKYIDKDSFVVYPAVEINKVKTKSKKQEYITFISPDRVKGLDIVLELADRLPKKKFLVLGYTTQDVMEELKKRKNITYIFRVKDIRSVYQKTKILIVPSLWQEGFGMVVVEANSNGIPCIVSNKGGLPEALGNGGIVIEQPKNIEVWIEAIESLDNKKLYNKISKNGIKHANKFDHKKSIQTIQKLLKVGNKELV